MLMDLTTASTSCTSDCGIPVRDELFPALLKAEGKLCQTKHGKPFSLKQGRWGFHFFPWCCIQQSITCSSIYDSVSPSVYSRNSGQLFSHLCYSLKMSLVSNLHKLSFLYHTCKLNYMKKHYTTKCIFAGKSWIHLESSHSELKYNLPKDSLSKDISILLIFKWNFLSCLW